MSPFKGCEEVDYVVILLWDLINWNIYDRFTPSHLFKGENRSCKRALLEVFLAQKINVTIVFLTVYLCGIAEGNEKTQLALDMRLVGLFGIRVRPSVRFNQWV